MAAALTTVVRVAASRRFRVGLAAALITASAGCAGLPDLCTAERYDKGYTLLLTGVTGHCSWDDRIARNLAAAKVDGAIEIVDWTRGKFLLPLNLFDMDYKQRQIERIAAKIVDYRRRYPGRPVHLIGLSGGGGVAVKTLEALPPDTRVTSAILLAPAISKRYDLQAAQARTERGIHNFYSPYDLVIGGAMVCAFGTIDGAHTSSAAMSGFAPPKELDAAARAEYEKSLVQHPYSAGLIAQGHPGGHFGWTGASFVRQTLAPLVAGDAAPPAALAPNAATEAPPEVVLTAGRETAGGETAGEPQRR